MECQACSTSPAASSGPQLAPQQQWPTSSHASGSESGCSIARFAGAPAGQRHGVVQLGLEASLDSLHSDFTHEELVCDELLLDEDMPQARAPPGAQHSASRTLLALGEAAASATASEVADIIGNEQRREQEIRPAGSYLERHSVPGHSITADMRAVAVSWLVEVVTEFKLQQETLFLAVSYLDRFLSLSQPVPRAMLQLVAVACISLAAKQEEVEQPTANEWADISDNCFQREDLIRMEWLVIDSLGWRGRTPTHYSFLHLFCYGLANCSATAICTASYLSELALLDYSMLEFSYSTIAAAALALAHATVGATLDMSALLQLAPQLDTDAVRACFLRLAALQQKAAHAGAETQMQGLGPVRGKYAQQEWSCASLAPPPSLHNFC